MKKIIIGILLLCVLVFPIGVNAMTQAEKEDLILYLIQRIIALQQQLNEMLAQQQQLAIKTAPVQETDDIAPSVSMSSWKNKTIGVFQKHDWCNNGGLPCGVLGLTVDYTDPQPSSGIDKIQLFVDDKFIGIASNGTKVAWDTKNYSNGEHKVSAKVYDKAGNVGEGSEIINIINK